MDWALCINTYENFSACGSRFEFWGLQICMALRFSEWYLSESLRMVVWVSAFVVLDQEDEQGNWCYVTFRWQRWLWWPGTQGIFIVWVVESKADFKSFRYYGSASVLMFEDADTFWLARSCWLSVHCFAKVVRGVMVMQNRSVCERLESQMSLAT